jgi:hypothetical protein
MTDRDSGPHYCTGSPHSLKPDPAANSMGRILQACVHSGEFRTIRMHHSPPCGMTGELRIRPTRLNRRNPPPASQTIWRASSLHSCCSAALGCASAFCSICRNRHQGLSSTTTEAPPRRLGRAAIPCSWALSLTYFPSCSHRSISTTAPFAPPGIIDTPGSCPQAITIAGMGLRAVRQGRVGQPRAVHDHRVGAWGGTGPSGCVDWRRCWRRWRGGKC